MTDGPERPAKLTLASETVGIGHNGGPLLARAEAAPPISDKRLVFEVPEAGAMLGLSRNASYQAAKRGDFPTIKIGKLIRVPKAAFLEMLEKAGVK